MSQRPSGQIRWASRPAIVSASRRTDIPAHYAAWLLKRLNAGFCDYYHPYSRQWYRVSLDPVDVHGIVFWTRDAADLLPSLRSLRQRGYRFYFQFTITGLPASLEPNTPSPETAIAQVHEIADRFGPDCVQWRFDPIVHTGDTDADDTIARFRRLMQALEGSTRRCFFSFMSTYRRQRRAFRQAGVERVVLDPGQRKELTRRLVDIAAERRMTMHACCSPDAIVDGVHQASCVAPDLLRVNGGRIEETIPKAPTRDGCHCHKSIDIGAYDTCIGGCIYCYANQHKDRARENYRRHDPNHLALAEAFIGRE